MKYIKKFESDRYGYNVDDLIVAVNNEDFDLIEEIIDSGVDLNSHKKHSFTPLHAAVYIGVGMIDLLLAAGADINAKNTNSQDTALIYAARNGNLDVIFKLIDSGANWNDVDQYENDFLNCLNIHHKEIVIQKYPEEYQNYLIKKEVEKYNL